jgi:hypothetical protein
MKNWRTEHDSKTEDLPVCYAPVDRDLCGSMCLGRNDPIGNSGLAQAKGCCRKSIGRRKAAYRPCTSIQPIDDRRLRFDLGRFLIENASGRMPRSTTSRLSYNTRSSQRHQGRAAMMNRSRASISNAGLARIVSMFSEHLICWKVGLQYGSRLYFEMGKVLEQKIKAEVNVHVGTSVLILEGYSWTISGPKRSDR